MESVVTWEALIQFGIFLVSFTALLHAVIHNKRK